MPRSLLAVYTCHAYNYTHDSMRDWLVRPVDARLAAVRDTWLKDVTIDYKMFYGNPPAGQSREPLTDEVFLNSPDNYYSCSTKTRELIKWALANGYDRLLKVDDDVFVHWDRMISSKGFEYGDYVGGGYSNDEAYAFGFCYWLSKKSMEIAASAPIRGAEWAEDKWLGLAIQRNGVKLDFEDRYYVQRPPQGTRTQYVIDSVLESDHPYISLHSMNPATMRKYYKKYKFPEGE